MTDSQPNRKRPKVMMNKCKTQRNKPMKMPVNGMHYTIQYRKVAKKEEEKPKEMPANNQQLIKEFSEGKRKKQLLESIGERNQQLKTEENYWKEDDMDDTVKVMDDEQ
jgi:hypothetical protein